MQPCHAPCQAFGELADWLLDIALSSLDRGIPLRKEIQRNSALKQCIGRVEDNHILSRLRVEQTDDDNICSAHFVYLCWQSLKTAKMSCSL